MESSRREFLIKSSLAAGAVAAPHLWIPGAAQAATLKKGEPIKVGLLFSLTGALAVPEEDSTLVMQYAIDEINKNGGIAGHQVQPIVVDADKTKQIHVLLNGQNNGAMPAWKQLSDTEIAAVITYTKNHWSNTTGQIVQPTEVAALRK